MLEKNYQQFLHDLKHTEYNSIIIIDTIINQVTKYNGILQNSS